MSWSKLMLAGTAMVYLCGAAWLAVYVPAGRLLALGVLPFVLGDLVKVALVAAGSMALSGRGGPRAG